ncbi:transferase [Caballeronia catudaia]|uniref:Transferase n=1 Tax=Caballeronia catudaia TaxID=1777136 RepID=A0A157ZEZ1_9BURK|nr:DegT/DnrJ/EryC1/StrS family aminotransferase [Caballeronia catudaia]SAK44063.1 transferase [Caballeronia catudaia]
MSTEKIKVLIPQLPLADAILPYMRRIDEKRTYSNYGPLATEFRDRLGVLTGATGVTITSNGTTAIEVALRIRARPGARYCLMPSYTFIASAHAVCNAGLTPYLLDVSERTLTLTPELAKAALRDLDEEPAAVLVVSAFGAPPDQAAWRSFEEETGVPVVFDAAAATTSIKSVGKQPLCVSLHATKALGIGEGGAILCSDESLIERATAITGFGFLGAERVSAIRAGNYRISEYAGAVGLAVLDALPERLAELQRLTDGYRARIGSDKQSRFQEGVGESWLTMTLNVIVPPDAVAATAKRLDEAQVEWRRWWGFGCHTHPAFADVPRADLTTTEAISQRVIGLPFHNLLSDADLDRIVRCLP